MKIMIWWHRWVRRHTVDHRRVSVPMWDLRARGDLYLCSCGEVWAR